MATMTFFADLMSTLFERGPFRPSRKAFDMESIGPEIDELLSGVGEVSGVRLARDILSQYQAMDEAAKRAFFEHLASRLDLDADEVIKAADAYRSDRSAKTLHRLTRAAEPRRQELLRRLNQAPGATDWLVRMREELLRLLPESPELDVVDADFQHLFASWFNRGFLVLRRIDWHTPANILEKIIEYEAVHAINDWQDLRRRVLPSDRRCFAFFHPAMPEEPLIFVEVALCRGIPNSIQDLLDDGHQTLPEHEADTAVFYSISNCQEGLKGISFGNLLIKQVVEELAAEVPSLKTFVTLSPVPGFNRWLRAQAEERPEIETLIEQLQSREPEAVSEHGAVLRGLCAQYLIEAKGNYGRPIDPVARFHLGNGALLHDIHALADKSANGWDQSSTVMVNYLYDLKQVSRNSERFMSNGEVLTSKQVRQLLPRV
ncbi:hypothetical protein GCM10011385_18620 [Nitratireductor aestuarii]|uniref:Malonyl-CoA decarboxylase n=2 Tax=Nitratireductor aestuarii TaxID=1735103 RepID=A0A916RSB5_9HYPH|nr:hypothetical protein GCM10011385_18620 [Nitratireductor aestuarii]